MDEAPSLPPPLSDPRRSAHRACWVLLVLAWITISGTLVQALQTGAWDRAVTPLLGVAAVGLLGVALLLSTPARGPDVLFLRSFRSDAREHGVKALAEAALAPALRVAGIRAPRRRLPLALRVPLFPLFVLLYARSRHLDLEAGADWPRRLWRSLGDARGAVVDARDLTEFVGLEIRLAARALGPERCLFLTDDARPEPAWRAALARQLGDDARGDALRLARVRADDPEGLALAEELQAFGHDLPRGTAGLDPLSEPLVAPYAPSRRQRLGATLAWAVHGALGSLMLGHLIVFPATAPRDAGLGAAVRIVWVAGALWFALLVPAHLVALVRAQRAASRIHPAHGRALARRAWLVGAILALAAGAVVADMVHSALTLRASLEQSRRAHARAQLRTLRSAVEQHRFTEARYPATLDALVESGELDAVPVDPWGRPYRYVVRDPGAIELASDGADGRPGTADDVGPD